jgi:TonB family protein
MMRGRAPVATLLSQIAIGLVGAAAAFGQPASPADTEREVREALARPMTPAAMVLLLPHASRPPVVERFALGLRDPNPDVRAVAARVAFTTRHQGLRPALIAALEIESQAVPAAEMMRALALIAGPAADDAVFAAIARLGGGGAWVSVVSRTRPLDMLSRLAPLEEQSGAALVLLATSVTHAVTAAFAPMPTTPALEPAYLAMVERTQYAAASLPWPVIAQGLQASPGVRRSVVRLLLRRQAFGRSVPPETAAALAAVRAEASSGADPWLTFVLELVRRTEQSGTPPVPLGPTIAALDFKQAPSGWMSDPWLRRLTGPEESALRGHVELPGRDVWPEEPRPNENGPTDPATPPSDVGMRMVRPVASGLVAELGKLTGCHAARNQVIAVEVAYRPTGQVAEVFAPVGVGVDRCARAARLLGAIDIDSGQGPLDPKRTDLVLIGFRPEDGTCAPVDISSAGRQRVGAGRIRAPRKVRNITPVYPQSMQDARIQGVTIAEATIATTGCVVDAVVLRGPHPTLNAAALAAVSLWQYEPTLLDGKPVPVIMTVTVNFTLQ